MIHIDVLIIDDEEKFANMLSRRIQLRGCQTKVFLNAKESLEWLSATDQSVRLILLDLQLPDMYGTKALSEIKKINKTIPVIILTGHGSEKDKTECEQLGAYKFMHKPLNIDTLMVTLEQIKEAYR